MSKRPAKRPRDRSRSSSASPERSLPITQRDAPSAEISFNLAADRRSNLSPCDVANMVLWCLPCPLDASNENDPVVPAVACPRWLSIRNNSSLECIVVICCSRIAYEDILGTPDSPLGEDLSRMLLGKVRRNELGGENVAYAPLWIRNQRDRLAEEFFMRNASSKKKGTSAAAETTNGEMKQQSLRGSSCAAALQAAKGKRLVEPEAAETESEKHRDARSFSDHGAVLEEIALELPRDEGVLRSMGYLTHVPATACDEDTSSCVPQLNWMVLGAETTVEDLTQGAPLVVAFDCEMVECDGDRVNLALARATLVNAETGETIFDVLVKPSGTITDYLTRYSGITEEMLRCVTTTVVDVQNALIEHVVLHRSRQGRAAYIVGHSLENDFRACRIVLGRNVRILDTVNLFPHAQGLPYKNALRHLAMVHLGRRIQHGEHDSAEDARVCAELLWLKVLHGPSFGCTQRVSILGMLPTSPRTQHPYARIVLVDTPEVLRTVLGVGCPRNISGSAQIIAEGATDDEDAARRAARALRHFGAKGAMERPRLVWLHLRGDVRARSTGAESDDNAATTMRKAVVRMNEAVEMVINSAPLQSLVVLLAGRCSSGDVNSLSQAHGGVFAFVKSRPAAESRPEACGGCAQT
jgi:DNA polymerase III epsilon subunit-like protein